MTQGVRGRARPALKHREGGKASMGARMRSFLAAHWGLPAGYILLVARLYYSVSSASCPPIVGKSPVGDKDTDCAGALFCIFIVLGQRFRTL